MVLAYGSVRWWKIFSPYQFSGINRRFVAIFAVPLLSFHFISTNNPYTMNFRFIAADTLQKIIMLFPLAIWNFTATPRGSNFNHADFDSMMGYDLYSVQSTSRGPTPRPSNFKDHVSSPRFGFYPAQRVPAAYPAPDLEFSSGLSKNSQQLGQAQPQTLPVPNNGAKASHDAKELHKFVWSSSASPVSEGGGDLHVFGGADYRASDQSGRSDQGAKEIRMLVPDDHAKRSVTNKAMVISVKPLFLFLGLILALFVPCNGDLGTAAQWIPPYMPNACGFDASQFPGNNMFAAAGESLWDSGAACGRQYMVGCTSAAAPGTCIAGQTISIMIVDRALTLASPPSSEGTSMVLSGPAFQTIATTAAASINIDFQQI